MDKKIFNKNYLLILFCAGLFYISSFMMNSVRGKYCVDVGRSKFISGMVIAVFTLSSGISRPVWAYYTDKTGRRLVIFAGLFLCLGASVLVVINNSIIFLLLSRFVFGRGYSGITTRSGTLVCDVSLPQLLAKAISFYGITNVISQAVAPSVALGLYNAGFVVVCIAVALVIAVCIVLLLFIKYDEKTFLDSNNKFAVIEKTALPAAVTIFFFAGAVASVYSYVPVMARERNISNPGLFFILSAFSLLAGRLVNTKLSEKISLNKTFYGGCICLVAGFGVLGFSYNIFMLCISAMLYGFGAGIVHPITNTAAVSRCRRQDRGLATGTFMMSQDFGMTVGAFLRGTVSGSFGFTAVYLMSAAVSFCILPAFNILLKDKLAKK